jgi:hypothetical protein
MSFEYETDTRTTPPDEGRIATASVGRVGRRRSSLPQKLGLGLVAAVTIRSQTIRPATEKSVEKSAGGSAPPARPPSGPATSAPGIAPPLVDEDGDGIDDGVVPSAPSLALPAVREPGAIAPQANQYSGTYISPRTAPGTLVLPAPAVVTPAAPLSGKPSVDAPAATPKEESARSVRNEAIEAPPAPDKVPAQPVRPPRPVGKRDGAAAGEIRQMGDKTFRRETDGTWVDVAFDRSKDLKVVEVVAGSGDYQRLLATERQLGAYFRLSDQLVVVFGDTVYRLLPKTP